MLLRQTVKLRPGSITGNQEASLADYSTEPGSRETGVPASSTQFWSDWSPGIWDRRSRLGRQIFQIGTVRYAEGLWCMRRHGLVIAHCTDSEDFPARPNRVPNRHSNTQSQGRRLRLWKGPHLCEWPMILCC